MAAAVIIEAAINGATPKSRNPNSPRTVEEIATDAIACVDAGAAIVHNHNDDPVIGSERVMGGWHDPQPYVDAWRAVLDQRPETILYPTMGSGGPGTEIAVRYSHIPALAAAGVLGQGLIDPGCVALGGADAEGLPNDNERVYINTYRDARHMFETCNRLERGASISIFEPGFLRVVLAYHKRGLVPKGSLVKLYFGGDGGERNLSFGMLPNEPCLDAYLSMLDGTGLPWSVAILGGDAVGSGFARLALEKGGHVRVGLEDYAGPRQPTNVELLEELTALCSEVGRPVATPGEARALLGLPAAP